MTTQEFEIFAARSRARLLTTARSLIANGDEAEDVVQEALIKLYSMRDRLSEYRNTDALATVVVKHLALNVLRHHHRHRTTELNERVLYSEELQPDDRIDELLKAIDSLPSKQQMILRMKHIEGMEVEEIASAVQMSHDAIYQNLSRARRAILEQFKQRKNG